MKLSVVSTLYMSAPYLKELLARVKKVAAGFAAESFEIIWVNDGSPDASLACAVDLSAADEHLTVIDLSRNFGHHKAMMAGLHAAKGDYVFLIDSDLEEEPEWLQCFADQMQVEGADMVYGVQAFRKGNRFEQLSGKLFYRAFRLLTGIAQPDNIVTARLMTKRYVNALLRHRESELNIGGLWIITGFKQLSSEVRKHSSSPTTYSVSKKFEHFVNAVTSFSSLPLVFTFYTGLLVSLSATVYIGYLVFRYFFVSSPPDGYTSIIASIWLFSGLIIFFIGIQGIYIAKVFSEVKQRPHTIVRDVYRFGRPVVGDS
jgi:putative glycosyltransferase